MADIDLAAELRRWPNLLGRQLQHVADGIDHDPQRAPRHIQDDHDSEFINARLAEPELEAQVNDRDDHAAQVDDAPDELRRMRNTRDGITAANFLHAKNVDAVLLGTDLEAQILCRPRHDGAR